MSFLIILADVDEFLKAALIKTFGPAVPISPALPPVGPIGPGIGPGIGPEIGPGIGPGIGPPVGPFPPPPPAASLGVKGGCPLCDRSVYSYCYDKMLHDACCCNNGNFCLKKKH